MKVSLIDFEIENDEEYFALCKVLRQYECRRGKYSRSYTAAELSALVNDMAKSVEKVEKQVKDISDD